MERKEFKQRLRGLFAWMLVMMLVVNNMQGGVLTVHAEETEGATGTEGSTGTESTENMVNVPVNYSGVIYTEDGMTNYIAIKDETTAGEEDAYFTSTDYTTDVTVEADATVIPNVVLPSVEKDGYFFINWELEINAAYDETTQEVSLGDGWTAADLKEEGLSFVANFEKALTSEVVYTFKGGIMNGESDVYSYSIMQPNVDTTEFEEPVITSVPTQEGMIFNGWQMDVGYQSWYDEETGMIHGVYGESVQLLADWRAENTVTIEYVVSEGYTDIGAVSETDAVVTYYESQTPAPVKVVAPEVTLLSDEWFFNGWYCEELSDMPSTTFEVYYPECEMSEDGATLVGGQNKSYTMYADFVMVKELMVEYDANNGTETTQQTITQSSLEQEEVTITLPEAPEYDEYKFAGWYCEATDEVYAAGTEATISLDYEFVRFIAQWECEVPITYDAAGGTITSTNHDTSVTLLIDTTSAEDVTLPTVEKDGYFFLNWELGISSGGSYGTGLQNISWDYSTPASSLTELPFTANWQEALVSAITYEYTGAIMNGTQDSYATLVTQKAIDSKTFDEQITAFEPIKEGYIFTGWELQANEAGSGSYEAGIVSGNYGENYTLTAQWRPENTITITTTLASGFENAGTIDSGIAGVFGESTDSDGNGNCILTLMEVKDVAEGYLFAGWKLYDASGTAVIMEGYTDITDYDGTVVSCYPVGTTLFIAYPEDDNNVGGNNVAYILEAQFKKAAMAEITFNLNGGTVNGATDLANQQIYQTSIGQGTYEVVIPDAAEQHGYEFTGWASTVEGLIWKPGDVVTYSFDEAEIAFTAQFTDKEYVIPLTYNTDGGTISSEEYTTEVTLRTNDISAADVVLPEVQKDGYFFLNWELEISGGSTYSVGTNLLEWSAEYKAMDLASIPLKANWQAVLESTISYDLDGGTLDGKDTIQAIVLTQPDSETTTFTANAIVEGTPVKEGYIFKGWEINGLLENTSDGTVSGNYGTDYTITALWRTEDVLHFTYTMAEGYEDMGEVLGETELVFRESVTEGPVSVTLPGVSGLTKEYLFVGWKCLDYQGEEYIPDAEKYVSGIYGTEIDAYPAHTMLEMDYVSAEGEALGNEQYYTFEAQFVEAKTIDITYDLNGGTGLADLTDTVYQTLAEETTVTIALAETVPIKEGYEFSGWLCSADNSICKPGTTIDCVFAQQSVKFTAQWEEKEYELSLTYDTDGGKIVSSDYTQSVTLLAMSNTAEAVELPVAEKEGYFFKYWKLTNNDEAEYLSGTQYLEWGENQPAHTLSGLVLKAYWEEALKSTITYNLDGGTWSDSENSVVQEFVQPDKNTTAFSEGITEKEPVKNGYVFLGWSMTETDTSNYDGESGIITGVYGTDYVLTALWEDAIEAGTYTLQAGEAYRLAEGNWTVNGDTTVYVGGSYFYVSEDGDYTFTKK